MSISLENIDSIKEQSGINKSRIIGDFKIKNLLTLEIITPEIQRIIDRNKVNDIVDYQIEYKKKYNKFNFMGVINIHVLTDKGYYLIDGQHRFESAKKLHELGHDVEITVEFIEVNDRSELENNYKILNLNTELPDFPDDIEKNIPEEAALYFQNKYRTIWSKNSRSRKPHIYFNFFQEALADLTKELNLKSSKDLIDLVENKNNKYKNWPNESFQKFKVSEKILNKCREENFYLGLHKHESNERPSYEWVREIVHEEIGVVLKKNVKSRKKKIPKTIKNDSWNKYVGKQIGITKCFCCNTVEINQSNFEAGHIISEFNGGPITVDNILPICGKCNRSMGKTNMDEFISNHYPENLQRFTNRGVLQEEVGIIDNEQKSNRKSSIFNWLG